MHILCLCNDTALSSFVSPAMNVLMLLVAQIQHSYFAQKDGKMQWVIILYYIDIVILVLLKK